ncbi:MAG: hypothetical protein ABIJ16_01175 [Bacteroidota bacterium]
MGIVSSVSDNSIPPQNNFGNTENEAYQVVFSEKTLKTQIHFLCCQKETTQLLSKPDISGKNTIASPRYLMLRRIRN